MCTSDALLIAVVLSAPSSSRVNSWRSGVVDVNRLHVDGCECWRLTLTGGAKWWCGVESINHRPTTACVLPPTWARRAVIRNSELVGRRLRLNHMRMLSRQRQTGNSNEQNSTGALAGYHSGRCHTGDRVGMRQHRPPRIYTHQRTESCLDLPPPETRGCVLAVVSSLEQGPDTIFLDGQLRYDLRTRLGGVAPLSGHCRRWRGPERSVRGNPNGTHAVRWVHTQYPDSPIARQRGSTMRRPFLRHLA